MVPWTGISCCVVVARQPHSLEPTSAAGLAFPKAPSSGTVPAMAACPEGWVCGPHVLAPLAQALVMAASHCLATGRPSQWVLSLGHQVAAPCPSASRQSRMAWRMTRAAWPLMTRVALSWSLTMARPRGGGLSVGGAFTPGALSPALLGEFAVLKKVSWGSSEAGLAAAVTMSTHPTCLCRAYEDAAVDGGELTDERPAFPAVTAPLAQPERGSLGSLDRLVRRSPSVDSARKEPRWRDPELPEVLAMLRHPVDPVKANAAAYLQHLCFENEGVKRRVRQLRGLPLLVALLDHPRAEVRRRACGALRNLSYGRDTDNKAAIRDCGGVPALVRLLRAARDNEVRELVTGTLWNLSSYEPLKMVIIDHGLQTLTHEVIVPHSGWEREPNEDSKPRDAEWTTVFKNTSGCLRNVSSDGAEARRRLRECEGLVDALLHALQSAVGRKDTDNKSVENCVCIMRNLSYHVHKEVPGADRYQEAEPGPLGSAVVSQRRRRDDASCFGGKKAKEEWFHQGKKDGEMDRNFDTLDLPKRTEAAKGFELLYQPEVVRLYLSLLTESRNFNTLEAAAGALQNLSAGNWMWATYIRATVRKERGLPVLVELLQSETDKVVRAVAIALRNLSLDRRNKDLIGSYAMAELVRNVRNAQAPPRPGARLEEDTVVAVLNTIHEIVSDSLDNTRSLLQARGVPALVALVASSQSVREAKAASHVLQTVWSYKELRGTLQKDGWTKARFQSAAATAKGPKGAPSPGGFDDSTLPLVDKSLEDEKTGSRDVIPMDALGPDGYSTVDRRERRPRGIGSAGEASEKEPLKLDPSRKAPPPGPSRPAVRLVDAVGDAKPQPVDSWV
nr:PREDICTED: armadillo repeat protein deleted in velo-cardio-facial syndrome isoform X7 [Macaca fascicularis]